MLPNVTRRRDARQDDKEPRACDEPEGRSRKPVVAEHVQYFLRRRRRAGVNLRAVQQCLDHARVAMVRWNPKGQFGIEMRPPVLEIGNRVLGDRRQPELGERRIVDRRGVARRELIAFESVRRH